MIQDIEPHRLWNEYEREACADEDSRMICVLEDRLLMGKDGFPRFRDLPEACSGELTYFNVFSGWRTSRRGSPLASPFEG